MIQTMMSVRTDSLLPVSSPRLLPVSQDFRWNDGCPSSGCSSQQSHRSAPSGPVYTDHFRLALDKSDFNHRRLRKSRSRDHIDGSRDHTGGSRDHIDGSRDHIDEAEMTRVLRHSEHFGNVVWDRRSPYHPSSSHPSGSRYQRTNTGSGLGELTSGYLGDDCLDADENDSDTVSPPEITPVSGRILTAVDHPIVKPIPFKPVAVPVAVPVTVPVTVPVSSSSCYPSTRKASSQNSSLDRVAMTTAVAVPGADDGYASRDWQDLSSSSSVSQNSFPGSTGRSSSGHRRQHRIDAEPTGGQPQPASARSRRRRGLSFTRTPSPSDSALGELEAMLREREMELQTLRDTMERNETAMMQVFEERRQNWEVEMGDTVHEWQMKLRGHQQRSYRTEQSLLLQIFKLQQENKNLRTFERTAKEPNGSVLEDDMVNKMEEMVLERKQLTMEINSLKAQLRTAVDEASNRSMEVISSQLVLKDSEVEIDSKNAEIHRLLTDLFQLKRELTETAEQKLDLRCRLEKLQSIPGSNSSSLDLIGSTESLKVDLTIAQRELEGLRGTLGRERNLWSEEKTKVINYQKHLQLNYIQMVRKNKLLEMEVHQMTSELERHDNECQRVTMDESFC